MLLCLLPLLMAITTVGPNPVPVVDTPHVTRITDMAHWRHPAKKVFVKYDIEVQKVVLRDHTHAEFYVSLPQTVKNDKRQFEKIVRELARANGYWDFSLIDETDAAKRLEVRVACDKAGKTVKEIVYK
jgi:hypothetical protein